jgi:hypothetical protein
VDASLNVPLTDRYPPTLIVFATVFVIVPLDEKNPLIVQDVGLVVAMPIVPKLETLPAVKVLAPVELKVPFAPRLIALVPASTLPDETETVP